MTTNLETIKVYTPDEGKALKVMQNNKLVMYMLEPLYYLPHYTYDVIEVDKEEAIKWINRTKAFTQKLFKKK